MFPLVKKSRCLSLALILGLLIVSNTSAAPLEICLSCDLPLPLKNLVVNGGFEDGMKRWSISGGPNRANEQGWKVELSQDAHKGESSLYVRTNRASTYKTPGVWQDPGIFRDPAYSTGKSYVAGCWVKAGDDVSNTGGVYFGAGTSLGLYSSDWKRSLKAHARTGNTVGKWRRIISNPVKAEDWCRSSQLSAGLAYTGGETWIDDICIVNAYATLTIKVKGDVRQVTLEDENGKIILESDPLNEKIGEYKQDIEVLTLHTYTVNALDKDGAIIRKSIALDCEESTVKILK